MAEIKELQVFRSTRFIFYATLFTVIALTPNTYYVFYDLSAFIHPYREIFSAWVALIIAGSIMIYTLRKNAQVAVRFFYFEVTISMYYYIIILGWSWALIPAFGFAFMMPYSLSKYTKELPDAEPEEPKAKYMQDLRDNAPEELKQAQENYEKQINDFMNRNPTKKPNEYWYDKN